MSTPNRDTGFSTALRDVDRRLNGSSIYKALGGRDWTAVFSFSAGANVVTQLQYGLSSVPKIVEETFAQFVEFVTREDLIGAAHYLNQILDINVRVHLLVQEPGAIELSVSGDHADFSALSQELMNIEIQDLGGAATRAFTATCISLAQTLYRNGDRQGSQALLSAYQAKHSHPNLHMIRDVELAQNRLRAEGEDASVLVRNMAVGGLDYLTFFKGKYCQHPFDDFEVRSDGETFVCCPSFLPHSIGNVFNVSSPTELRSSESLHKIQDSIIQQDFRYCRWMQCNRIKNGLPDATATAKREYLPVDFRLSYDPTCNLWCPSCRNEKIVAKGEQRERILKLTDDTILPLLKTAHSCMMNGYGDVFASKACRRILECANPIDFPNLKFNFITNGVLFTRQEWEKFPGIHSMIDSIRVSIDAACKETYDKNRLGGNWDVLMENLDFIADLRRQGTINEFMISMVVQDNNAMEMTDFALMARKFDCDLVIFEPIINWNTYSPEAFAAKAVHYGEHPQHQEFRHELDRMRTTLMQANEQSRQIQIARGIDWRSTREAVNF